MEHEKAKVIAEAVGNRPLTAEERYDIEQLWKEYSDVDKFRMASKLINVTQDVRKMTTIEFIRTCAMVADLDQRYGTETINRK